MQINLAAAENMTANELFSAIQLLDNNHLTDVLPILLNKMNEILEDNEELRKEVEESRYLKETADEVDNLKDRLDRISQLADY